jgi:hypothetical protein
MPRERAAVEGAESTDTTTESAPRTRKPRAKNGTRKPRASKDRFIVSVEIETTKAGLADVNQFVDSLQAEGTTARIKSVHGKE